MLPSSNMTRFAAKNASALIIIVSVLGLVLSLTSSMSIQVAEMGETQFFLFEMMPLLYWIGLIITVIPPALGLLFLRDKINPLIILASCICLVISMRLTFPGPFPNPVTFSNDNAFYMGILRPWLSTGLDFGVEGRYQHDFPLSFLISFAFLKLGVSLPVFFRWAPTVVFAINFVLSYLIFKEVFSKDRAIIASIAVFLFASSTLKYFLGANYCPSLIGATFLLVSFYFTLQFYKKGWSIKAAAPAIAATILLVISHHLSIVYFVVLVFGMAFAARFFQGKDNQGAELRLFFIAIFTYTFWWAYGHFLYPSFFNTYVFTPSPSGTISRVGGLTGFDLVAFVIQPLLISILFLFGILRYLNINSLSQLVGFVKVVPTYIVNVRQLKLEKSNDLLFYTFSFSAILVLLVGSFVATNLYSDRVLDVFLFGLYPLAANAMMRLSEGRSRKVKVLFAIIFVLLIITSTYRYFRENQRALLLS